MNYFKYNLKYIFLECTDLKLLTVLTDLLFQRFTQVLYTVHIQHYRHKGMQIIECFLNWNIFLKMYFVLLF